MSEKHLKTTAKSGGGSFGGDDPADLPPQTSPKESGSFGGDAPAPKPPLWTKDFALITICNLLVFTAFQSLPAVLPLYLSELGVPNSLLGLAAGVTTITAIITRPFAGAGVDSIGRKFFFILGLIAMVLTIGPVGLIPSIAFVLIMRTLLGLAWGFANTAATTVAGDVIPRQRFGEGMGYFSMSSAIALAIAPAVALSLLDLISFEYIAIIAAVLVALALLMAVGIKYKPVIHPPASPANAKPKLTLKQMISNMFERSAVLPGIIVMFSNMVYGAMTTFVALLSVERGLNDVSLLFMINNTALFFVVYAVMVMISRPLFGKLVDRRGYFISVTLGLLSMSLGLVFVVLSYDVGVFLLSAAVFGVGQGCVVSSLQTMAVADASFERRGAATSTFFIFFDGGIGVGAVISGAIAGAIGITGMYAGYIALPLVGLAIYLLFARHRKNPTAIH